MRLKQLFQCTGNNKDTVSVLPFGPGVACVEAVETN